MSRGAVSNKTFPGATGTEETKPGRKVRHTSRSQSETEVPNFHTSVTDFWWPYPLLTQTNGYSLSKAIRRGKHRKISPPLIINYLAQSVNDRGASQRLK